MNYQLIRNIARFILLILLQIFVFNNFTFNSYIIPYVYILFILLLPFETPKWVVVLTSFFLGLFVDFFYNTLGLHAAACTLIGFVRPVIQNIISLRRELEQGTFPGVRGMGIRWFFFYTLLMVSVHHLMIFYLESFRFHSFISTFFRAFMNILVTTMVLVIADIIFSRQKK